MLGNIQSNIPLMLQNDTVESSYNGHITKKDHWMKCLGEFGEKYLIFFFSFFVVHFKVFILYFIFDNL